MNIFNTMIMLSYIFCFATTFLVASSTATEERSNLRGLAYETQEGSLGRALTLRSSKTELAAGPVVVELNGRITTFHLVLEATRSA